MKNRPVQGRITAMGYAVDKSLKPSAIVEGSKTESSMGEILLFIAALATLLRFAIPNYHSLITLRDEARARATFIEASSILDKSPEPFMMVVNGTSSSELSSPLSNIEIPSGTTLDYLVKVDLPGFFSLKLLSVTHKNGEKRFRLVELDEKRIEQIITN